MGWVLGIAGVVIFIILATADFQGHARRDDLGRLCEAKGGIWFMGRGIERVCLRKDAVIELKGEGK